MSTWFTLDGVSCEDAGIHVLEYPPFVIARRKIVTFTVPGAQDEHLWDGDWGYEDVDLPVRCTVDEDASMDAVISFLTPSTRRIIFGHDPAYARTGFLSNMLEISKVIKNRQKREFTAVFQCSPFKALAIPASPIALITSGAIDHPGTARCYPTIEVRGSGDATLTFHAVDDFVIQGLESNKPFIIDSAAMICTNSARTADWSSRAEGDYPWLDPGINTISFTGDISRVTITPNFLWL